MKLIHPFLTWWRPQHVSSSHHPNPWSIFYCIFIIKMFPNLKLSFPLSCISPLWTSNSVDVILACDDDDRIQANKRISIFKQYWPPRSKKGLYIRISNCKIYTPEFLIVKALYQNYNCKSLIPEYWIVNALFGNI